MPSGQVLAKHNRVEITEAQFNFEAQRLGAAAPTDDKGKSRLLEQLVARSLLEQEAINDELDRQTQVMLAVDAYRKQLLAETYLRNIQNSSSLQPSLAEVRKYYDDNPSDFSQRRLMEFRVVHVLLPKLPEALDKQLDNIQSFNELLNTLTELKITHLVSTPLIDSAGVPPEARGRINQAKLGDIIKLRSADRTTLLYVSHVATSPISLKEAEPFITQLLTQQKMIGAIDAEVERLHSVHKPNYIAKFYSP